MKLRPETNNTAVRFFNGNDPKGDADASGSGPMIIEIEEGDGVSFSLPVGFTLRYLSKSDLGQEQWGIEATGNGPG